MPNPLSLMRRSLSNPAWFKADVARKALVAKDAKETAEAKKLLDLVRRVESHTEEPSPETYFQLRREMMRPEPEPLEAEQLRLPGFDKGGRVSFKGALDALKNYSKLREASDYASKLTNRNTPGWSSNGYGDAARHALAAGLIARNVSPDAAVTAGEVREWLEGFLGQDRREEAMDNANARFGARMAPHFPSDETYVQYIQNWPEKARPQRTEGALQWFGSTK